ncbi:MAG TPA: rod-binding protein [Polyangiaceae bacterium]|nr:rod-binding protein [Polyangiaceae bacterium]
MKIEPLHPAAFGLERMSAVQEAQKSQAQSTSKLAEAGGKEPIDPEKLRLAREFEQIFLRKMLSPLEKSGHNAGASASSSGDAYGSMVVSALAEAVSKGGGIGLAEVIARAASQPTTTTYPRPVSVNITSESHDIKDLLKDPNR